MIMTQNKDHWYDGWFYDKIIAPNQDRMFSEIKNFINPNSKVIDVGCGTGRLSFSVEDKVQSILGIDLSIKNIKVANQTLSKKANSKISFQHTNLSKIILQDLHFDYAVMTYVIHEVNPDDRIALLREMAQIADKIIIGDYLVPVDKGFWSFVNKVIEFLAGEEHYNNFKHFIANNGLYRLADKAGLKIVQELKNIPATSHIVILTKI